MNQQKIEVLPYHYLIRMRKICNDYIMSPVEEYRGICDKFGGMFEVERTHSALCHPWCPFLRDSPDCDLDPFKSKREKIQYIRLLIHRIDRVLEEQ